MNRYLNSLTLPLAVAMAVGTVDAKAQALEEVIVTAQKREQSLQDVPIAVAAFSNEMLQKAGVKDMFELQANDPSLVVGQGHNASTSSFGIRGVFTSSNNFGLESSVGLYVDGVYRARQGSMLNDLVDIGRIEILRGVLGILPPNIAKTAAGRASCGFWRPITYRLSAGSHQSIPLNPQVLAIHLSVRMCIYPGG